jgi:hypothetical protein
LHNDPDPIQALSSNYNPSLYVAYYSEASAIISDTSSPLCQIYLKDILLCKLQIRFLQLEGPRKSTTRDFTAVFTGTTERIIRENNYFLLQQLLKEVRGDCTLTLRIINDFSTVLQRAVSKEEGRKRRRQAATAKAATQAANQSTVKASVLVTPNPKQSRASTTHNPTEPSVEELQDILVGAQDSELALEKPRQLVGYDPGKYP